MKYEPVTMHISVGDVVTSRKGFLVKSALTSRDNIFSVKRQRYLGNGVFECLSEKIEMDVKELER